MNNDAFRKSPVAAAVSAVSLALAAGSAQAQEAPPVRTVATADATIIEEVVVTGIRQSLKQSRDLKRDAFGVVDAITAEDIGNFPDTNLAESLQRITGVSIDRVRGEGSRITVRGLGPDFNLVLLNGRQMPRATADPGQQLGRSFDFGNLAAENVSAVEVYKSGRADVPTGGMGATINVRTTRPLENPGLHFTAAASGMHDESTDDGDDVTPEVSALFSNTFFDDRVGVALSGSYQDRDSGADTASVGGWRSFPGEVDNCWCGLGPSEWGGIPPAGDPNQINRPEAGDIYSVPQSIGYELAEYQRTRSNGQLTLQFLPTERVTATVDYTFYELELERTYNNLSAWFNFGGQETEWTDGPQASPIVYSENSTSSDYSMGGGADKWKSDADSLGMNLVWDATDRLSLMFDYHESTAKFDPQSRFGNSALLSTAAFSRDVTTGYFGQDLPILQLGLNDPLSPDDMIVTGSVFTNEVSKMDIDQATVSGMFDFDYGFIQGIDFGVQFTDVDNRAASSVVQRDAWGGVTQPGAISDLLTPSSMADDFDEVPGGGDPRRQTDYYTFNMVEVIERTEALMASGDADIFQANNMGDCGTGLCASSDFSSDRRTKEETEAAYVQVRMGTALGDMPIEMRAGLRYETTDITSKALSPTFERIDWIAGNELTAIQGAEPDFTELEGDYDYWLPNFDFRIDLTDNLVGRASVSETITRPNYGDIQGGQTINSLVRVDGGTGNRGNPALKPFESFNLDFSVEFYYGDSSYISAGYFRKDVDNFIGITSVVETTFDLPHPALGPLYDEARTATGSTDNGTLYTWILENRADEPGVDAVNGVITGIEGRDPASPFNLTVPTNIEESVIDGWELAIQHDIGQTGFGFIANATWVDADVDYEDLSLAEQFVVTGLSDSANLIAYYDKHGLNVRLAYNWRDNFIAGTGQANVGAGPPTYTDNYAQWDMSANYWFTDQMNVFMDILNLTDETTYVHGRDNQQTLFATQLGRRWTIGFRYKL